MKFNKTFITGTLMEAADYAATTLSQRFALKQMAEKGSCTLEEAQNLYELSYRMLTEGSEDLIPENLELPDATDEVDPTAAQDAAVDNDVAAAGGEVEDDFAIEDLEGIILPDSEGNQYLIQGGILVPYNEDDDSSVTTDGEEPADDEPIAPDDQIAENTTVGASAAPVMENTIEENTDVAPIEENTFAAHSSIIANLIQNTQFK